MTMDNANPDAIALRLDDVASLALDERAAALGEIYDQLVQALETPENES